MDLYEYQARDILSAHGVPVERAVVVTDFSRARSAAKELKPYPVVVKAQVKAGGRGKSGGVKLAHSADQAEAYTREMLGAQIKGHKVSAVMIAEGIDIADEYYFSIHLDRTRRCHLVLCSREGGVNIETLAQENPQALVQCPLDPKIGIDAEVAQDILTRAHFKKEEIPGLIPVLVALWNVYEAQDATLVEINPLVRTKTGQVVALDIKMTLDDSARFRHPEHAGLADTDAKDPLEVAAQEAGLNYLRLDGEVGIIGNGAGLVMSTLDVVIQAGKMYGVRPANFLDIVGGASREVVAAGMKIVLSDPQVRSILVNIFGGITACDEVAHGILNAAEKLGAIVDKPMVVRLDGNQAVKGRRILAEAQNSNITLVDDMDEAALSAVIFASESRR